MTTKLATFIIKARGTAGPTPTMSHPGLCRGHLEPPKRREQEVPWSSTTPVRPPNTGTSTTTPPSAGSGGDAAPRGRTFVAQPGPRRRDLLRRTGASSLPSRGIDAVEVPLDDIRPEWQPAARMAALGPG